ncbi:hypothetical protein D9619_007911 [Psilocybe cf. subviscida]|uniref:Reverse transcriptase zinc-binding domain-containing protein n=1 Tax=Psilocybe cf. subviscida TaxID=2480587 RepID=A0A8H5ATZ5_9AGAR|nr:hypothetical protein D9619_007911 [Psilocybe cf. subviscida]
MVLPNLLGTQIVGVILQGAEGGVKASLLIQLRTGHIALNAYLHRFKLTDDPLCTECRQEPESVLHILKFCPAYAAQRRCLQRDLGPDMDIDLSLLSDRGRLPLVFAYLEAIGRFVESHGSLTEEPDEEQQALLPNGDPPQENDETDHWA